MMIFMRNSSKALIEGRFCVVIACNQRQFSGCHDDNSNRITTSEHVMVPEAWLEYESIPRDILKVDDIDFLRK